MQLSLEVLPGALRLAEDVVPEGKVVRQGLWLLKRRRLRLPPPGHLVARFVLASIHFDRHGLLDGVVREVVEGVGKGEVAVPRRGAPLPRCTVPLPVLGDTDLKVL